MFKHLHASVERETCKLLKCVRAYIHGEYMDHREQVIEISSKQNTSTYCMGTKSKSPKTKHTEENASKSHKIIWNPN